VNTVRQLKDYTYLDFNYPKRYRLPKKKKVSIEAEERTSLISHKTMIRKGFSIRTEKMEARISLQKKKTGRRIISDSSGGREKETSALYHWCQRNRRHLENFDDKVGKWSCDGGRVGKRSPSLFRKRFNTKAQRLLYNKIRMKKLGEERKDSESVCG